VAVAGLNSDLSDSPSFGRMSVSSSDVALFAQLDMIYNQFRVFESKQNETKFACKGSGKCCRIGLRLHMFECASLAFKLRQQFYLLLEDQGLESASSWMDKIVESLTSRLFDDSWVEDGGTELFCPFLLDGCSVYDYRPLVCRSFGTIMPVDDYCPRERNDDGGIDSFGGPPVIEAIRAFQDLLASYSIGKPDDGNYDMVVYMPLGVLSFLLPSDQLRELFLKSDAKFWHGLEGWFNYRTFFTKRFGYDDDILLASAKDAGLDVFFDTEGGMVSIEGAEESVVGVPLGKVND
jgi:Fe-S-cluster containining protein